MNSESLSNVLSEAKEYLENYLDTLTLDETGHNILEDELIQYDDNIKTPLSIEGKDELFYKMIISLTNRQGFNNFIGSDVLPNSSDILFDYNPAKVYKTYKNNPDDLLRQYKESFPNKKIRNNRRSAWVQYVDGIISIAKFLSSFNNLTDFDSFVRSFAYNDYTKASLPMLLSREIKGYGFALACDFLKETGYSDYGKPDIHLKDIFVGINLVDTSDDLEVFRMISKISNASNEKPAVVDKVFWIIGSGKFNRYNETHSNPIPVKRMKEDFIKLYNSRHGEQTV